jgi:hypothetical protein
MMSKVFFYQRENSRVVWKEVGSEREVIFFVLIGARASCLIMGARGGGPRSALGT